MFGGIILTIADAMVEELYTVHHPNPDSRKVQVKPINNPMAWVLNEYNG